MGVPKFFRWISERYPNLSVNIENNQIPVFDCLYLDMNGIIHVCSHPDDANVQFRITEEQIFSNVFKYIDFLFKTVKPREVFFLAVDGVAPRAKMNQQRGRRFKSAKEAKDRDFAAVQNGIILPTQKRFDSNAITPGTEFMDRLQQALREFIAEKVTTDNLWHGVDVILSGHETPGEGEHKIQEFIRYRRSLPNYNPNTRHCLYGLDADLMLLGLASHEPYFSLLREEVTFSPKNKVKRAYIAEETKFFLLHLSLLRAYIDYEFSSLKSILEGQYDLERIIDDWIVLSFLVGNDFVPHLPNLHIHASALPLLWQTYIKIRPQMNGYINEHGQLNLRNLSIYIADLSSFDHRHFEEMFDDMKWMFGKTGKKMAKELENLDKKTLSNNNNSILIEEDNCVIDTDKDLIEFEDTETEEQIAVIENNIEKVTDDLSLLNIEENDDGDGLWQMQFHANKTEYYYNKLSLQSSEEMLADQAKEYFTALQWISYYYFSGVPSWSWFYPQHYAPFVSDLVHLGNDIIESGISFDIGRPFLPFEQLMAVLPSDSSELLPDCFNILMTMENSPIIDFYPRSFKSDLNGKKREWEALVLIPFIEEERLLNALDARKNLLKNDEARRNKHSPHIKFQYSQNKLMKTEIDPAVFRISRESIVFGLCENVQLDVICQGFPTFSHVEHSVMRERAFVKVFENNSTLESIVLKITPAKEPTTAEIVARSCLHKLVYVNWPAFILTKVVAVLDKGNRITLDPISNELIMTPLDEIEAKKLKEYVAAQPQELYKRRAVTLDLNNMLILETLHSEGNVYEIVSCDNDACNVTLERNWIVNKTYWHLHQLSVLQETIDSVKREESKVCTQLNELLPIDEIVFCLDSNYYGQSGRIQAINNSNGWITVKLDTLKEPEYSELGNITVGDEYMTAAQASDYLDIDAMLLSKISGSIYLSMSRNSETRGKNKNKERHSIGLDLKNNKLNLQVPGWVIKTNGENGIAKWLYSMKVVKTLDDYRDKFPEVFEFIRKSNFESLTMEDVFEVNGNMKLLETKYEELKTYLEGLEYRSIEKLSNDHILLTETHISVLENFVDNIDKHSYSIRTETPVEVKLMFKALFKPHHSLQGTKADMTTEYKLLDRVVCCTEGYTVPLGSRGVVIGIEPLANDQTKLEVLFDQEFKCAISIRGSKARCYRMPAHTLINTSHGIRKYNCAQRIVRTIPLEAVDGVVNNSSNSNYSDWKPQIFKKATPVVPEIVNNHSSGSDFLATLFLTASTELPPMPTKKYGKMKSTNCVSLEDQMETSDNKTTKKVVQNAALKQKDFLAHCDLLFKSTQQPSKGITKVFRIDNCPSEYATLLDMCIKCGIPNPAVVERHVGTDVMMSFKCGILDMPEVKETDLTYGRQNHVARVWSHLYSVQQQRPAPIRYQPPQFHHHYVPPQFQGNPFTALYPSSVRTAQVHQDTNDCGGKAVKSGGNKPQRSKSETGDSAVAGAKVRAKKFIQAPKSTVQFPKEK